MVCFRDYRTSLSQASLLNCDYDFPPSPQTRGDLICLDSILHLPHTINWYLQLVLLRNLYHSLRVRLGLEGIMHAMLSRNATKHNRPKAFELLPENPSQETGPRGIVDFRHGAHRIKESILGEVCRAVSMQVSIANDVVDSVEWLLTVVLDHVFVQGGMDGVVDDLC